MTVIMRLSVDHAHTQNDSFSSQDDQWPRVLFIYCFVESSRVASSRRKAVDCVAMTRLAARLKLSHSDRVGQGK